MSMRLYAKEENGFAPYEVMLAQEGKKLADALAGTANPNLLINSGTTARVNQRNYANETQVTNKYTIDRWYLSGTGKLWLGSYHHLYNTAGSGYVYLLQHIENPEKYVGEYTLSVNAFAPVGSDAQMYLSNQSYEWLGSVPFIHKGVFADYAVTINIPEGVTRLTFGLVTNTNLAFKNPKMEKGSIATPFIPRHYAEELALCQRYFQPLPINRFIYGVSNAGFHYFSGNLIFPVKMRVEPTITLTGCTVVNIGTPTSYGVETKTADGIMYTWALLPTPPQPGHWQHIYGYADAEIY